MSRVRHLALGGLLTAAVITGAAVFSAWPAYQSVPDGMAVVKLSFTHGGQRECRQLSEEERAKLPPNMRRREVCDRERPPVHVRIEIDGNVAFAAALPPTGLSGDGPSRVYETFTLPAGRHEIALGLRDTAEGQGFTHTARREVTLEPGQNLAIDFEPAAGGFVFN